MQGDKTLMRIGIYQADGKLPNLACMKITAYHEDRGDHVESYRGDLFAAMYDKIYISKIFSFTQVDFVPENAIIGGTGIDFYNRLPDEIDQCAPSYSLAACDYHLGFSMSGCRFACSFCCVPKKEGKARARNSIDELLRNPHGGDRLMLLDNDFFGGPDWESNLKRIIELNLKVCFVQGLNIRILKPEQAELLAKCRYTNSKFNQKYLTFAWDRFKDKRMIDKGIEICRAAGIPPEHMQFFILVGYDSSPDEDMERILYLRNLGAMPFVMPYNKSDRYQKNLARWVNNRAVFKSVKWSDYKYNATEVKI